MSFERCREHIKELYDFALRNDLQKDWFISRDNVDRFVETAVDAYRDYPLFCYVFGKEYDAATLSRMMSVDFRSRIGMTAGIASGNDFESVMLLEPPMTGKVGIIQYTKVAKPSDYPLLLKPSFYRQEAYESFARKKRQDHMDKKTWYLYLFATKKEYQKLGFGKKLMEMVRSFADENGCRICLETDLERNVAMYEHFGFRMMDASVYKDNLKHFVMLYG